MKTYEPIFLPGGLKRLAIAAVCFFVSYQVFFAIGAAFHR